MSLYDKILSLCLKYGTLSSERITYLLKENYGETRSLRSVQRHIEVLVKDKKLIPVPSSGRQQAYAIYQNVIPSSKPAISQHFLSRFWDELFKLRDLLSSDDKNIYPRDILDKLTSLVKMLPKPMKDQIMPSINNFWNWTDSKEYKELEEEYNKKVGTEEILFFEKERRELAHNLVKMAYNKRLENIIDLVSTYLHQAIEEGNKNE